MKPFKFSLQAVRRLRQHKEESVRQRYAGTLRACEAAAARMQSASTELTGCWATLCEKLGAGVNGDELLKARAWCNVLELRVKERGVALEQARHAVDAVWQELMSATRDREVLDRLHDQRKHDYDRDTYRVEQKNLDDLAVQLSHSPAALRIGNTPAAA